MPQGIYGKYNVTKADGSPMDEGAVYFVLRLDTDSAARTAVRVYANEIRHTNRQLSQDLQRMLNALETAGRPATSILDVL